ncbi:MAG: hypothetical protein Q4B28_03135 [bacterium]|nr:hypothetical protein [bacterium]
MKKDKRIPIESFEIHFTEPQNISRTVCDQELSFTLKTVQFITSKRHRLFFERFLQAEGAIVIFLDRGNESYEIRVARTAITSCLMNGAESWNHNTLDFSLPEIVTKKIK